MVFLEGLSSSSEAPSPQRNGRCFSIAGDDILSASTTAGRNTGEAGSLKRLVCRSEFSFVFSPLFFFFSSFFFLLIHS